MFPSRPGPQRRIAVEDGPERARGQDASQHAQRGSRVPGIEGLGRRLQGGRPFAHDGNRIAGGIHDHLRAERFQAGQGRAAVTRGGKVIETALSAGQRGENGQTMGERLVPGESKPPMQPAGGSDASHGAGCYHFAPFRP